MPVRLAQRPVAAQEPAATLGSPPPRSLRRSDQMSLWANMAVSLTLLAAAPFVLAPQAGAPSLPLAGALVAVVVGSVIGSLLLALGAVPGARTGAPAMVLLRGLLGWRGSWLPTGLNLAQCLGWVVVEVVVIAEAAHTLLPAVPRYAFVLVAGVASTAFAIRPLGLIRVLRRYAVWVVLAALVVLFVGVLRHPLPPERHTSWHDFSQAVDAVVVFPVSWIPLAADYSRHSRSGRDTFVGTAVGYTGAAIALFALGLLALAGGRVVSDNVTGALAALPLGALALWILIADELDKAFANLYSTVMSTQNLRPLVDRRLLAVAVGAVGTAVGLVANASDYENFLYLIGSVFTPLAAVFLVDYFLLRRGRWDTSVSAPSRWRMLLPWAGGFVAYQLVNHGSVSWWASWWARFGTAPSWLSATLTSLVVAALLTVLVGAVSRLRSPRERPAG
jgi:NCS1 family nucleobase:cation symporter-1